MYRLLFLSSFISSINSLALHRDLEFINRRADPLEWTALGDSYASGVGSTDYVDGGRCLRYNEAYPVKLNSSPDLAEGDHIFNNCVCSGATAAEIVEWQLLDEKKSSGPSWQYGPRPAFGTNPSFATLTAGGDDIDFPGIIFNCILDWHSWYIPITRRSCEDQIQYSKSLLSSTTLVDNLDLLIKNITAKGRSRPIGDKFRLYVTGYPRFFSTETTECDNVTFARDANPNDDGKEHPRMTQKLRTEFNDMSDGLNRAVQDAVDRNKDSGATFVDIQNVDGQDMLKGHRYCENGITEPNTDNTNLYFWHYPYKEAKDIADAPIVKFFTDKFHQVVGDLSTQDSISRWPNQINLENAIYDAVNEGEIPDKAENNDNANLGWDSIGFRARVFHPQPRYHDFIRDRILAQYKADTPGDGGVTPVCPQGCTCDSGTPLCS